MRQLLKLATVANEKASASEPYSDSDFNSSLSLFIGYYAVIYLGRPS